MSSWFVLYGVRSYSVMIVTEPALHGRMSLSGVVVDETISAIPVDGIVPC